MAKDAQPEALPVTTARARLFDLVEDLLAGRRSRIELVHRDHDEHVLLVRMRDIETMEADLAALRARLGVEVRPLRGSATLEVDPEQVLLRTRGRQADLAAAKRASLRTSVRRAGAE